MIIFKRFGFLVFLSIPLELFTILGLVNLIYGKSSGDLFSAHVNSIITYLFWLPAFYNFILEKIFCRNEKEEIFYDKDGNQVKLNNFSTFFFIRNKYWTYILFIVYGIYAVIFYLKR